MINIDFLHIVDFSDFAFPVFPVDVEVFLIFERFLDRQEWMNVDDFYETLTQKLIGWGETVIEMLPNLAAAFTIVALFWVLSRFAQKVSDRALERINLHAAARGMMSNFVQVAVFLAGFVIALGVLNLDKALASILAGAGIVGLALGFAFQDLAANIISGVGLAINHDLPFKIGDTVETNDVFGVVRKIYLRTSIIDSPDGKTFIIPNKQIYQNKLVNYSLNGKLRIDVKCGISYGDDLEHVKAVASKAIDSIEVRDTSQDIRFFFSEFGDSSINFVIQFWISYSSQADYLSAMSTAIQSLKTAFDTNNIMIPFPIRTLDFGIRGGKTLSESLSGFEQFKAD